MQIGKILLKLLLSLKKKIQYSQFIQIFLNILIILFKNKYISLNFFSKSPFNIIT
jgi:hypothetical protein